MFVRNSACIGNISKSLTGTLEYPKISEAGRAFLSNLLDRLTDDQLRDLFTVARFPSRAFAHGSSTGGTVDEWVAAFKAKRSEIAAKSCGA